MKSHILYFALISLLMFPLRGAEVSAQSAGRYTVRKIVIDPGHGGRDSGCSYGGVQEKDVVLAIALRLGELINQNLPDVTVIYTRKTDVFIELVERGDIANRAKADLFLSIHADAVSRNVNTAMGSSSWVMGLDKTSKSLDMAMRENDVVSYEKDFSTKYEGYVPGDPESYIMFSLMQYAYMDQSMNFATIIQKHYIKNTPIKDRGARQGPFLVLWRPAMPSVLTETGFLSNPSDRKYLVSKAGQERIARSLFNAFSEYKSKTEGNANIITLDEDATELAETADDAVTASALPTVAEDKAAAGKITTSGDGVQFRIQVSASAVKINTNSKASFGAYAGKVVEKKIGRYYKYFVGETDSYRDALSLQREVSRVFKDAFVVAFKDDAPVTLTDAMKKR